MRQTIPVLLFLFVAMALIPVAAALPPDWGPDYREAAHSQALVASDSPLVYTQNLLEGRVLFIDPVQNTRVLDFHVGEALPQECLVRGEPSCGLIGGHHTVLGDHDYVEVDTIQQYTNFGMIARISLRDMRPMWRLTRLDFSNVENNGVCRTSCDDSGRAGVGCHLLWVHEFIIADENPAEQWIELIFAEMVQSRVVKVRLDYRNGNTCGDVQWVIDSSHSDWPESDPEPNGVQLVDGPEGQYLVTTLLTEDMQLQDGGARVFLWDLAGERPQKVWSYPEAGESDLPFINAAHHGLIQTDPITGQRYLLYGHSLGASEYWNHGEGGTFGIAVFEDLLSPPQYLGDWVLPASYDVLNFTRELEFLPDGSFFGVDAGCYWITGPEEECPAQLYWFSPETLPFSSLPGYFSSSHEYQNIVTLPEEAVTRELRCGLNLLFEADVIQPSEMGQELREAQAAGGTDCPAY